MKSKSITLIVATLLVLSSLTATAEPNLDRLTQALGNQQPDSVTPLDIPSWYEVVIGGQILYLSEDGRYALQGDLIDMETAVNLTEQKRDGQRQQAIAKVGQDKMIIFEPEGEAKHTISVFTDIDCGYCRKMHSEMDSYLAQGIRVRYLAFPRAGVGSESFNKAVWAWCADNQQEAITRAKQGKPIEEKTCDDPVADEYNLGIQLGVRGTPSIVTDTGKMIPGYVPAARLAKTLTQ